RWLPWRWWFPWWRRLPRRRLSCRWWRFPWRRLPRLSRRRLPSWRLPPPPSSPLLCRRRLLPVLFGRLLSLLLPSALPAGPDPLRPAPRLLAPPLASPSSSAALLLNGQAQRRHEKGASCALCLEQVSAPVGMAWARDAQSQS